MMQQASIITPWLPNNLESLHKHEEELRTKSILHINGDGSLKEHMQLVQEALDMLHDIVKVYKQQTDDELTVQYLGIRLFNTIVSSNKLMLSGYYQNALALQRDIIESGFLLEYLGAFPEQIAVWKSSDDEQRHTIFKPSAIRKALDNRKQVKGGKRGQIYKRLCEYASHPTYKGFKLVAPKGLGEIGPFYDEKYLAAVLGELVLRVPYFTLVFTGHFKHLPVGFLKTRTNYMLGVKRWSEKYLKLDFKNVDVDNLEQVLTFL